jgi:hypothetical protein
MEVDVLGADATGGAAMEVDVLGADATGGAAMEVGATSEEGTGTASDPDAAPGKSTDGKRPREGGTEAARGEEDAVESAVSVVRVARSDGSVSTLRADARSEGLPTADAGTIPSALGGGTGTGAVPGGGTEGGREPGGTEAGRGRVGLVAAATSAASGLGGGG